MKKYFIAVLLTAFVLQASAQEKDSMIVLPGVTVTANTKVAKVLAKAFKKAFPDAQDLTWYKANQDFLARFIENDMKHSALFTKRGTLRYDISYGFEQNIPGQMREKVRDAYEDYKVTRAANVKMDGRNIWVITLESLKHFVLVRIEDDELEEVEKLNKS